MDKTVLTSSLKDTQNDLIGLHAENKQLQSIFDAIANDLGKIQDEHSRATQFYDHELAQIRQEITNKQETIDNLVENNVSLRFELSTYRRLLDVEEKHMNRVEQGQTLMSSYQMPTNQILNDLATKKMTVQKTARG
jgi:predicted  nucleic acid-binding Zn-ribbon protein